MTGSGGRSSTPRKLGLITGGSDYWMPAFAGMTPVVCSLHYPCQDNGCFDTVIPCGSSGGSHDGRRMVRFRSTGALSGDDRADQIDRVSPLRQFQAARPRIL